MEEKFNRIITDKEKTILEGLAGGYNCKEIAIAVGCSYGNVRRYVDKLMSKTGATNSATLITWGFRNGYIK